MTGNSYKNRISEFYNSFILLMFVYAVARAVIMPYISTSVFIIVVTAFIVYSLYKYSHMKRYSGTVLIDRNLIRTYVFLQVIIVLRGVFFNYSSLTEFLSSSFTNPYSTLAFIMPLLVFVNPEYLDFKFLKKIMMVLVFIFIYVVIDNYQAIFLETYIMRASVEGGENYGVIVGIVEYVTSFFMLSAFLLFIPKFIPSKNWYIAFVCLLVSIVIVAIGARRSSLAYMALIMIGSIYFYTRGRNTSKAFRYITVLSIIGILVYYITSNLDTSFSLLQERGLSNSRETVEGEFWQDMGDGLDWVFGRGLNGKYYAASTSYLDSSLSVYRNICETGYLNIILTGGVVSLIFYISILLRAALRGWFKSNNNLTKAFSAYIVVSIVSLIPFGLLSFTLTFFVVWIGVSICNNPYYLNLSDDEIKQIYFK